MAGVWSGGAATISGVSDDAGNTYTKVTSVKASEDTELSVWSAPITAGGGTKPAITITAYGQRRHRRSCARVLRAVERVGRRGRRRLQDGDRHRDRGWVRDLGADGGTDRRQRPRPGLLRRLGLQPHAERRSQLHRARQRLPEAGHGVRGRGCAAAARRHAGRARLNGREHAVDDGDRRLQDRRRACAACALGDADEPVLQRDRGRVSTRRPRRCRSATPAAGH